MNEIKKPIPPFNLESAKLKVRLAENAWNSKNSEKIAFAYTKDSQWRNRELFINGREEIKSFLDKKFKVEHDYKLCKELWAYNENRISVRFAYEWKDENNQWFRSYGNENWEFNEFGLMKKRIASINDIKIEKDKRKFLWEGNIRPDNYLSLSEMDL